MIHKKIFEFVMTYSVGLVLDYIRSVDSSKCKLPSFSSAARQIVWILIASVGYYFFITRGFSYIKPYVNLIMYNDKYPIKLNIHKYYVIFQFLSYLIIISVLRIISLGAVIRLKKKHEKEIRQRDAIRKTYDALVELLFEKNDFPPYLLLNTGMEIEKISLKFKRWCVKNRLHMDSVGKDFFTVFKFREERYVRKKIRSAVSEMQDGQTSQNVNAVAGGKKLNIGLMIYPITNGERKVVVGIIQDSPGRRIFQWVLSRFRTSE
ncbi:MAG: hypothetical protein GY749_40335 [Desulfobacteraceae bacterium]|nr:hypothetical protein [Desulfobacteraceae bacterium]